MVHESTHVWQYVHGGGDYKLNSVYYRYKDGQDALYDWVPQVNAGKSWAELTAEHQARFVEDAFGDKCWDSFLPGATPMCVTRGADRLAFFFTVDNALTQGEGAP